MHRVKLAPKRKYKIALNLKPIEAPYGGGNEFLRLLVNHLETLGHTILFDLNSNSVDFIFLLDPRMRHQLSTFSIFEISRYLIKNPNSLVIHRVNECDERKGTNSVNRKLRKANCLADKTICVSNWLTSLDLFCRSISTDYASDIRVIKNGSNNKVFYPDRINVWNGVDKLKIVTHHWSSNTMKGAKLYSRLDGLLENSYFGERFEFTYIGKLPVNTYFRNVKIIRPLYGEALAQELRKHHIYITGSVNEPGGNHQNEAGLSGLPIIFLNSGSMKEYCDGFGVELQTELDLESALDLVYSEYSTLREKMFYFPHNASKMLDQYVELLEDLEQSRADIAKTKTLFKRIKIAAKVHLGL